VSIAAWMCSSANMMSIVKSARSQRVFNAQKCSKCKRTSASAAKRWGVAMCETTFCDRMQDSYYCEACGIVLFWVQRYARLQQVRGDGTAKTTADMILIVKSATRFLLQCKTSAKCARSHSFSECKRMRHCNKCDKTLCNDCESDFLL
jgi:hypothetical protein